MTDWIKKTNWLWAAGGFTLVYLIGAMLIIGPFRTWAFITTGDLNEVGDFLAGVFSPLAFIWLVAAVLTQRQELDETRDQFAENQKVVDAQMRTITSQNDLLRQQHEQAERSARQTYKLNIFDKRFDIYNRLLKVHADVSQFRVQHPNAAELRKITNEMAFVFSFDIESRFVKIADMMDAYLELETSVSESDELGGLRLSQAPEHDNDRLTLIHRNDMIREALSASSLKDVLFESMRVTEDGFA